MRLNIENRLHRVKIELSKEDVSCLYSGLCKSAENCERCNNFFYKCAVFKEFTKK